MLHHESSPHHKTSNRRAEIPWISMHKIDASNGFSAHSDLIRRYSKYKYGDPNEISTFASELGALISQVKGADILKDPHEWVLFTPPYSSVPPAARPLGEKVASTFQVPHIDFMTSPEGDRRNQYAAITDIQSRIEAKLLVKTHVPNPEFIAGKRALVVDDMITTGATAAFLELVLKKDYQVADVTTFCIIDLDTPSPSDEERINRELITSAQTADVVKILGNLDHPVNRHVVKSFYGEDKDFFDMIRNQLPAAVLEEIEVATNRYYGSKSQ